RNIHGYLCKKLHSNEYAVLNKQAKGFEKGFTPLTFRQIVWFGQNFIKEISHNPNTALITTTELKLMAQKNEAKLKQRNILVRLVLLTCDCARNLLHGSGFKSSIALTAQLSARLTPYLPKPVVPPRTQDPKPRSPVQPETPLKLPQQRQELL